MSASQVHAIIAAGLEDPALLARWKREPHLLRQCGVDPSAIDIDALWKFAGLATKVRHNGLRADIPLTFRLLNIAGLEIEVFGSYAAFHGSKSFGLTSETRSQDLLLFLEQWLDFDKREYILLWDLIRHELALARLGKLEKRTDVATVDRSTSKCRPRAASVPRVCGDIILLEMRSDPRIVETLLRQKRPSLEEAALGTFYFCYWRLKAEGLFILELDELGFYLLSIINGELSTADLSDLFSGSRKPQQGLLNALAQLATVGIIELCP